MVRRLEAKATEMGIPVPTLATKLDDGLLIPEEIFPELALELVFERIAPNLHKEKAMSTGYDAERLESLAQSRPWREFLAGASSALIVLALNFPAAAQTIKWPTITTNGPTDAETFRDGTGSLYVAGDLDGATLTLESALVDDPTLPMDPGDPDANLSWFAVSPCHQITTARFCIFTVGESRLRITVAGGGANTEINVGASRVRVAHYVGGGGSAAWTDDGTLAYAYAPTDTVLPVITLQDEVIRLLSTATIGLGVSPTLNQPHLRWPMPTVGTTSFLWVDDSFGTWSGLNIRVHTHRWTFDRGGLLKAENGIGISNVRGLNTASFRAHTSFNVGVGGDGANVGSLVATDAALTWDADRVSVQDLLRLPARASPPPSPLCGDVYFDTDLSLPCVYNCTEFVQMDDFSTLCS